MSSLARMVALVADGQAAALPPAVGRRLVAGSGVALAVAAASTAVLLALVGRPDWWRGWVAAGAVSALATALSLVPLLWGVRRSLNAAAAGYFVAMGVRGLVSLGGCLLVIVAGGYPQTATLLLMAVFYVAVLAVEVAVLAAAAWRMGEEEKQGARSK